MPRQARIVMLGKLHHVTQKGNYGQAVFFEDQDRTVYLKYVNDNAQKYGLDIFAFCLMRNHVHFIVRPDNYDSLAKTFRTAHQKYARYLNKRADQVGHLWQSRYYSCVVLGDHIIKAIRYVEQNPVRAGIVKNPWDYHWSSVNAHLGKAYKIVQLADIDEYIQVKSWKDFLKNSNTKKDIEFLRNSTMQGRVFASLEIIQQLRGEISQKILASKPGRPKKVTDTV